MSGIAPRLTLCSPTWLYRCLIVHGDRWPCKTNLQSLKINPRRYLTRFWLTRPNMPTSIGLAAKILAKLRTRSYSKSTSTDNDVKLTTTVKLLETSQCLPISVLIWLNLTITWANRSHVKNYIFSSKDCSIDKEKLTLQGKATSHHKCNKGVRLSCVMRVLLSFPLLVICRLWPIKRHQGREDRIEIRRVAISCILLTLRRRSISQKIRELMLEILKPLKIKSLLPSKRSGKPLKSCYRRYRMSSRWTGGRVAIKRCASKCTIRLNLAHARRANHLSESRWPMWSLECALSVLKKRLGCPTSIEKKRKCSQTSHSLSTTPMGSAWARLSSCTTSRCESTIWSKRAMDRSHVKKTKKASRATPIISASETSTS